MDIPFPFLTVHSLIPFRPVPFDRRFPSNLPPSFLPSHRYPTPIPQPPKLEATSPSLAVPPIPISYITSSNKSSYIIASTADPSPNNHHVEFDHQASEPYQSHEHEPHPNTPVSPFLILSLAHFRFEGISYTFPAFRE